RRALDAIGRDPKESHLASLRAVMGDEPDVALQARMQRIERLLTIEFSAEDAEKIAAIKGFAGDLGVDVRAALNPLLATRTEVSETPVDEASIASILVPGSDELPRAEAYGFLVDAGLATPVAAASAVRDTLVAHIQNGEILGTPVSALNTDAARLEVYDDLVAQNLAAPLVTEADVTATLARFTFYTTYTAASPEVAKAAAATLAAIEQAVAVNQTADLALDAISLASIYFLAAIGLAITFGVMGVINMAHGEFIMMGAYTGYVVQLFVPDHTLSILLAIPLAFAVTFGAGVAMERLVIRWLYHRPLETLLATFGVSIALQQLAKNIFGTQARPLTAPGWLDGSWALNDIVSISYIRIAIFVLALIFLALFLFVMNRTRLGLEVRAVTQNPRMAASMGINPDKINMLTFGFGSGIAGIAGVAIGLYAKVTSEMGADYIVQSFMTVVVGGVGNIWGTLLGATLVGTLQKGIEWMNPSNTLAAQTYMILFIILFIQFRPRGIIALKGRAAEA
ncbi:MAG: urea ABC transporter permease subunit UrtB, partial [Rhodobacteraceae bacterium]|nr:urea ABC transporter permease subunit UrtB [Paracoccaceae bacterium]